MNQAQERLYQRHECNNNKSEALVRSVEVRMLLMLDSDIHAESNTSENTQQGHDLPTDMGPERNVEWETDQDTTNWEQQDECSSHDHTMKEDALSARSRLLSVGDSLLNVGVAGYTAITGGGFEIHGEGAISLVLLDTSFLIVGLDSGFVVADRIQHRRDGAGDIHNTWLSVGDGPGATVGAVCVNVVFFPVDIGSW